MSEWKEYSLGDIAEVESGSTPSTKEPSYWGGDIAWITPNDLSGHNSKYISMGERNITKAGLNASSAKLLPRGTVVFSSRAPIGYLAIALNELTTNQGCKNFVCKIGQLDNHFLYYLLRHKATYIERLSSGSTFPEATGTLLKNLHLKLPDYTEQRAIAGVLSSLDDKIELLRKQNETLEAMASALFKHWFVDGAKETWDTGTLNSILSVKGGTTPSTVNSEYWNGIIHWTTPKDLSNNPYIFLFDTERTISKQGLDQISSGLLPVGTILLSSRAPVGYLAITDIPVAVNQGYIAIIDNKGYSKYFLYLWLKLNMRYIKANANGSTFREISKSVFKSLESIKPPKQLRLEFDRIVEPLFQKIRTNSKRIDTLTRLRDLLLLKLMSGEIRVEDINSNGKGNK